MTSLRRETIPYPWGALWFVAEDRAGDYSGELLQCVDGTREMVGMLPTGRSHEAESPPLVSLFVSVRMDEADAIRRAGREALRDRVLSLAPMAEAALDQLPATDALILAGYRDVRFRDWNMGPVVFIGDAAHAMSPQLGQGSNLALFDAMVLSDMLEGVETRSGVPHALARYHTGASRTPSLLRLHEPPDHPLLSKRLRRARSATRARLPDRRGDPVGCGDRWSRRCAAGSSAC